MLPRTILILSLLLCAVPVFAIPIVGRVRATGRAPGAAVSTFVYAEPLDGPARVQPVKVSLLQRNKSFQPRALVIPVGSTVQFPNMDPILHNVFSLNRPQPFDLGLYKEGDPSKSRTFTAPAVYRIFCNIHPQMSAVILVAPTSYISEVDASGNYRLDLPAGRYRITAWSERAEASSVEFTVSSSAASAPELVLDESKRVEPTHKNKYGQDYPKSAYDPNK